MENSTASDNIAQWDELRVSSGMVAQKNRKIGKKKWEKNKKIKSTFVDKDSYPAPHKGFNKGYESSDSIDSEAMRARGIIVLVKSN